MKRLPPVLLRDKCGITALKAVTAGITLFETVPFFVDYSRKKMAQNYNKYIKNGYQDDL